MCFYPHSQEVSREVDVTQLCKKHACRRFPLTGYELHLEANFAAAHKELN